MHEHQVQRPDLGQLLGEHGAVGRARIVGFAAAVIKLPDRAARSPADF
jgi:hypothetical protein